MHDLGCVTPHPLALPPDRRYAPTTMRRATSRPSASPPITRRGVIAGALVSGALVVGWTLWPRESHPNLAAADGETILNGFVKIGADGHVTVVCPQVEMGQGAYTIVAQIVADELGADWRTIAVEPAPVSGLYDNLLVSAQWKATLGLPQSVQVTGGSSTLREFGPRLRDAAAGARTLLCMAAADRWSADWPSCETEDGFVILGKNRLRFGALAKEAAGFDLPKMVPLRSSGTRIAGRGMDRLDVPAKLDGSVTYAADVRLPGMVFAAIRQGPPGDTILKSFTRKGADGIAGLVSVIDHERWLSVAATSWWAANRALDAMRPRFVTRDELVEQVSIDKALAGALNESGSSIAAQGDAEAALTAEKPVERSYAVGLAAHNALEPMAATASIESGAMQLWIATQVPGAARAAAARATGLDESAITVHAMQAGGSFGRKYECEIAAQVALIALKLGRPVQLIWSRSEDIQQDRFRPAAQAKLSAIFGAGATIGAWRARIATPDAVGEMAARVLDGVHPAEARSKGDTSHARAVEGAVPPYAIPHYDIVHHPVVLPVATGKLRGGAHGASAFFTESFIDELAAEARRDPFSFRMAMLGGNIRLAKCLAKVAARGGWEGGAQGTSQGLACHQMHGSFIAVLAEAKMGESGRVAVSKLVAVADVGRVMNPEIARQQIEGGLMYGLGLATGSPIRFEKGLPEPRRFGQLGLPQLADMPEVSVELIRSGEVPGGLGELAVPPVGPAIANALFAGSGRRFRSLPIGQGPA